jgi:hypothetical protein
VIRSLVLGACLGAACPVCAAAQGWQLDVSGGRIRSALDPTVAAAQTLAAGVGYSDALTSFRLTGGANTQSQSSHWAAIAGSRRLLGNAGAFGLGLDLSGNALVIQNRIPGALAPGGLFTPPQVQPASTTSGHALAGSALPVALFTHGPVQIQARAGVSLYSATIAGQQRNRTVALGDAQVAYQPSPSLALMPIVRRFQAAHESGSTYGGVSAVIAQGRVSFVAGIGRWLAGVGSASSDLQTAWQLGASLHLSDRTALNASARRDGFDPLYLNPPQTSWSVGFALALGARIHTPPAPVPAAYSGGRATIELPVAKAGTQAGVSIAGDFNDWKPSPMERSGDTWRYTVALAPGVYNYSFVSADGTWFVPEGVAGRKDDGMGGHVAVLVVK